MPGCPSTRRPCCSSRSPACRTASRPTSSGSSTIGKAHGAGTVRIANDEAERALLWKGRKNAFGAIARIKPNYYLHDTVVPRRRLPEVLGRSTRSSSGTSCW